MSWKDWLFWLFSTSLWRVALFNTTTSQADLSLPAKPEIHKGESKLCLPESCYRAIIFHFPWSQVAFSFTSAGTTKNLFQLGIHAVAFIHIYIFIHIYFSTNRHTHTYMHAKLQFHALLPFIHHTWRHTLWHRPSFHGTCYWPVVLQHMLAAEAWGSQGHSVPFQVLSMLVPKNQRVLSHSLQLFLVLHCPTVYCLLPLDL